MKKLEDIIRRYVKLHRPNSGGWFPCVHTGCDHGRKGPRAAFCFPSDGSVVFNCYNCNTKIKFDPNEHRIFYWKFKKLFNDFGIPKNEWKSFEFEMFVDKKQQHIEEKKIKSIIPKNISIPDGFVALKHMPLTDIWARIAYAYLKSRSIDADNNLFFLSKKKDKWAKRLIIPMFKDKGKYLMFYTGRDLTDKAKKKYENPMVDRNNVIFNFDFLFEFTDKPIFIVEGVMDALSIPDCVALLGNEITSGQIEWLNKSRREKVYIPDKIKGLKAAEKAIDLGWKIATPNIGECNDVNDAVVEYGILYVLSQLKVSISNGDLGKIRAGLYCEN